MIAPNFRTALLPKLTFAPLLLILIINALSYGLVISPIMHLLNISPADNAILNDGIVSMLSPVYLLAIPIAGSCSDRWGRKPVIIGCLIIAAIGCTVLLTASLIKSVVLALLATVLLDLTYGFVPAIQALVADISSGKRKSYFFAIIILTQLDDTSTGVLDKLISGVHNQVLNNASVIIAIAVILILANIWVCTKLLPNFKKQKHKKGKARIKPVTLEEITSAFAAMFTNTKLSSPFLTFSLYAFSASLYAQNSTDYLTNGLHITFQQAEVISDYKYALIFITLIVVYPILIRYFSAKKLIISCLFLSVAGMALNLVSDSYNLRWLTATLIVPAQATLAPLLWTMLSDNYEKNFQGILMGIIYAAWTFLWLLSDITANSLNYYNLDWPPALAGLLTFLAVVPMLFYREKLPENNSNYTF